MVNIVSVDDEYKKCAKLQKDEVLKLVDWVQKQPHLPKITELDGILFLHACQYSMEAAKSCLDTYFTCRTHCPEFFANRNVIGADILNAINISMFVPLPGLTPDGCKVMYVRLFDPDPSKFTFVDELKLFTMAIDLWLLEEGTAEGHILICDMQNVVFGHLAKLGIIPIKKYLYYLQEAIPFRLRGMHYCNTVSFMDKILALMRPFMKKELWNVLELHTGVDTMYKSVPQEMLPNEYGGKAGTFNELHSNFQQRIKANGPVFADDENTRRVNENLRPGKPKGAVDLFGIEGNFKKIEVD